MHDSIAFIPSFTNTVYNYSYNSHKQTNISAETLAITTHMHHFLFKQLITGLQI